ncbi:MAG: DUF3152 domain-containing protein [Angustibacter sp.]
MPTAATFRRRRLGVGSLALVALLTTLGVVGHVGSGGRGVASGAAASGVASPPGSAVTGPGAASSRGRGADGEHGRGSAGASFGAGDGSGADRSAPGSTTPGSTGRGSAGRGSAGTAGSAQVALDIPDRGSGVLQTVPGSTSAPGRGDIVRVRVQVEREVSRAGVDAAKVAQFVMSTLNDDRSWSRGNTRRFARTGSDVRGVADITVVLATPGTTERMCQPLRTYGRLSCGIGQRAVLTMYRWLRGTEEFDDLTTYRRYLVNHEVGHLLGRGHEPCSGAGRLAPVMQQQTIQVAPCRPNAWPYPSPPYPSPPYP